MPSERKANSRNSGLLSGMFSFVSREFEHFVANATGSSVPGPSISDEEDEGYDEEEHEIISKEDTQNSETRSPPRKRTRTDSHHHTPEARPRLSERSAASKQNRRQSNGEDNNTDGEGLPSPPPPSRTLKRRPSVTMPGSLFPRSPSMEPEGTLPTEREQRVRFASKTLDSPAPHFSPRKSSSSSSLSINSHSSPPSTPRRRKLLDASVKAAVDRFQDDADPNILLPNTKSSPHALTRTQHAKVDKGKRREADPTSVEDHNVSTVRGKEQELVAALEDLDRNERRLEESNDDAEKSLLEDIKRDRDRDKERIRILEEEIERLKEELLKRPASVSDIHLLPAVPPPPPPPPPPPRNILPLPTETSDPDTLFASARASLRHAPTPIENPINPLRSSRRAGMPTVGIAPDKMAAFLNEMKTIRLRKVSERCSSTSNSDLSFMSAPNLSVSDLSMRRSVSVHCSTDSSASVLPCSRSSSSAAAPNRSMSEIEGRIGEKRKRMVTAGSQEELRASLRRRRSEASSAESSFATNSTQDTLLIPSTEAPSVSISVGPSLSQSYPPPNRLINPASSSSVTDAPTPSLCSDNDAERDETSPDDQPPSTPPVVVTTGPSRAFYRFKGNGIPVEPEKVRRNSDVTMGDISRRISRESIGDQQDKRPTTTRMKSNVFDKRPPTSPFPNKSPRRPRPPARRDLPPAHSTPFNARHRHSDDDEDPLSLSFSSPDDNGNRVSKRPQPSTTMNHGDTHSPSPPPTPMPSLSSRSQSQSHPRRSRSASQSSRSSRRLTLDEELRNVVSQPDSEDHNERHLLDYDDPHYNHEEEVEDNSNSGMFVGVGTRSKRRGFLAGGGAGGVPVFMGVGYVDGAIDDEDEAVSDGENHNLSRRSANCSSRRDDDDDEYLPHSSSRIRGHR